MDDGGIKLISVMFACGVYPIFPAFLESAKKEAECNVKRLRHHPSLILFCGNNEDCKLPLPSLHYLPAFSHFIIFSHGLTPSPMPMPTPKPSLYGSRNPFKLRHHITVPHLDAPRLPLPRNFLLHDHSHLQHLSLSLPFNQPLQCASD